MEKALRLKKNSFTEVLLYFGVSRLFFALIILLSTTGFKVFSLFDAEHYISIARYGYYHESVTAFFPMMPILIRFLSIPGAIIVNNLCFYGSLVFLRKLGLSKEMLLVFALSPIGFFSTLLYTEGVYVFLSIIALYLYVNRKLPLLMGVIIGLSVLTRSTGALLFFAVFIGMCIDLYKKKTKLSSIVIAYIPATILSLAYPVFLQVKFGNWKLFIDCQYDYWIRISSNIFKTTWMSLKMAFTDSYPFEDTFSEVLSRSNEILTLLIFIFLMYLVINCALSQIKASKLDSYLVVLIVYAILSIIAFNATVRDPNLDAPTISLYRYYFGVVSLYILGDRLPDLAKRITLYATLLISFITSFMFSIGTYFY